MVPLLIQKLSSSFTTEVKCMQKRIYFFLIVIPVFMNFSVYGADSGSFTPLNPVFETWRLENQNRKPLASDNGETLLPGKYRISGKRPSPYSFRHLHNKSIIPLSKKPMNIQTDVIPERFDLRKTNKVARVKNQAPWGTCWTFGSLGSAESSALGQNWAEPDFSKKHLAWFAYTDIDDFYVGFDQKNPDESIYEQGGSAFMAIAMLSRWTGIVAEEDVPYQNFDTPPPAQVPNTALLKKTLVAPSGENFQDNVKRLLLEFGAVNIDVFIDNPAYDGDNTMNGSYYPETAAFYYSGDEVESNHAVLAVGWDDSFDKNNFLEPPPENGAWIVQNSWGDDWGDDGYFYISYYDAVTGNQEDENAYAYVVTSPQKFHTLNFNDPLGITGAYMVGDDGSDQWFSNVFISEQDQYIQAAGLYVLNLNTTLHISVHTDPEAEKPASGKLVMAPVTVAKNIPGYYVIDFEKPVFVPKGHSFSIVVQIQTQSLDIMEPIAFEGPEENYASRATAENGESFVSADGKIWTDMTDIAPDTNVCLKALGTRFDPETELIGDVDLNGKVDIIDALLVIRYATGMIDLTDLQKRLGNITGHSDLSKIGLGDALAILKLSSSSE